MTELADLGRRCDLDTPEPVDPGLYAAGVVRRGFRGCTDLVDVAVFHRPAPYVVCYIDGPTVGDPWIPFLHIQCVPVYSHRHGSIQPPRPTDG